MGVGGVVRMRPMTDSTYRSIPARNSGSSPWPLAMRWSRASHPPVMAALFTSASTTSMSPMPLSVATSVLPSRCTYARVSNVSMMLARVAGVPRPFSFIASDSSRSSRVLPAVSMAVSRVASLSRAGGLVRLGTAFASSTCWGCPRSSPEGSIPSSSASSPGARFFSDGAFTGPTSSTFQPSCSMAVPWLRYRSTTEGVVTSVTTSVAAQVKSSCQACSNRRQMSSYTRRSSALSERAPAAMAVGMMAW